MPARVLNLMLPSALSRHSVPMHFLLVPIHSMWSDAMIAFAARYKIPTIYPFREFADAGGLISYGTNIANAYRQAGIYAGQILKGAKPSELPIVRPTKI